jgi:hypothetical protein
MEGESADVLAQSIGDWISSNAALMQKLGCDLSYYGQLVGGENPDYSGILEDVTALASETADRVKERAKKVSHQRDRAQLLLKQAQAGLEQAKEYLSADRGFRTLEIAVLQFLEREASDPSSDFYQFTQADLIPLRARIPANLQEKISNGAKIAGLSVLPPARGHHVVASIHVTGPPAVMRRPHKCEQAWASGPTPFLGQSLERAPEGATMAIDVNYPAGWRTLAFGLLDPDGNIIPLDPFGETPGLDLRAIDLAMLLDCAKYLPDGNGGFSPEFNICWGNRPGSGRPFCAYDPSKTVDETLVYQVNVAARFLARIRVNAITLEGASQPSWVAKEQSTDLQPDFFALVCVASQSAVTDPAGPRVPTFSDQLGAVELFYAVKASHATEHAQSAQRKWDASRKGLSKIKTKARGLATAGGALSQADRDRADSIQGALPRLQSAYVDNYDRVTSLRDYVGGTLLPREIAFMWLAIRPQFFAFENLDMSTEGEVGWLATVIAKMYKDFGAVVETLHDRLKPAGFAVPEYGAVPPWGTSQTCYVDGLKLDRSTDWNYPACPGHGTFVDSHVNAAWNIAWSFIQDHGGGGGLGVT